MRTHARRTLGLARVVVHLARGAATMAVVMPFAGKARRRRIIQRWSAGVLEIFGVSLRVGGAPPGEPRAKALLLVGNHVSWIDIYAYLSVADVRFVAKSEVRSWPLIGWFAKNLGTIFVERDRPRDALRVSALIREALEAGEVVCVFPEGTTTDGSVVLPFSSVLLNPVVETGGAVQPVSIGYRRLDGTPCTRTAFTGDMTLVGSIWGLVTGEQSVAEITFLEPLPAAGDGRRSLARAAEDAVRERLGHAPRQPMRAADSQAGAGLAASGHGDEGPGMRPAIGLGA